MEYRKLEDAIVLRVDPDEDLVKAVMDICAREQIQGATVSGIGAAKEVEMGVFDPYTKEYHAKTHTGIFEIVSLGGNAGTMDGKPYVHMHIAIADMDNQVLGGHLNKCIISATGEIILQLLTSPIKRKYSETIGLNLIDFA